MAQTYHDDVNSTGIINYARKAERIVIFLKQQENLDLSKVPKITTSQVDRKQMMNYAKDCTVQVFNGVDDAKMWI